MFLCRAGRLSAAAPKCPGPLLARLGASGPGDVALTARAGLPRAAAGGGGGGADLSRAHLGRRRRGADPVHNWVTPLGFVSAERGLWAPVDRAGRRNGGGSTEAVLLTGRWGDCRRHRSTSTQIRASSTTSTQIRASSTTSTQTRASSTTSTQTRASSTTSTQTTASSTSAAAKKSEEQADSGKAEASTTSTSEKGLEDTPEPTPEPGGGKLNKTQQLKKVFKEYGAVGVSFHIGISLMSLGMFYLLISSGIDMAAMLCKLGFSETVVQSKMAAGTSTFVLAYAIHKLFAPVRISITLVSVPLIVRYFRKTGLFKPPTPAP